MRRTDALNGLTPAEAEALALLAEECAEVIQVIGKILRHGYRSVHPDDPDGPNNAELLEKEIGDCRAAVRILVHQKVISGTSLARHERGKLKRIQEYLHHAEVPR